jgi:hypothetical protein
VLAVLRFGYSKIGEPFDDLNKNNALGIKVKTLLGSEA